ncbi:aldo/keto reductase [Algoriphagus sp. NF]|uniref:aldo/keto reductase n=1 Tax=Algoriphagus sp. NF TaxID=2992756 RepID=UPI00237A9767|nr:aldo/keto reductase [Algoriphagus sp. NF]MDE0558854.1 aldo/keto reductase [Algoriphagus sp. NF]
MNKIQLPKTNFQIPEISLGCMSLPENTKESMEIIHQALDSGINLLDTADLYQKGINESNVGKAIAGRRDQVLISSKVGNEWRPDGSGWDWNPKKAYILKAVDESLKRLQTDYLDFYLLHGGTIDDPWDETLEAFEILKEKGKIRAFGISSIRPNVVRNVLKQNPPALFMTQYSPLDRRPEESIFPMIRESESRVLVRGSLAKGILLDKPTKEYLNFSEAEVEEIREIIYGSGFDPQAVLLRFGLEEPAIASLSVGSSSVEQVSRLAKAYELSQEVPSSTIKELRDRIPVSKYGAHR